jgi:hypothetical protein
MEDHLSHDQSKRDFIDHNMMQVNFTLLEITTYFWWFGEQSFSTL